MDWVNIRAPIWKELFSELRNKPGLHFLEIGSFEGRSACWFLENILTHPSSHITCIDLFTWDRSVEKTYVDAGLMSPMPEGWDMEKAFDHNIEDIGATSRTRKMRGASISMLPKLHGEFFDAIYIDGSHKAADVLMEAVLCWLLLKPEGVLMFDDYPWQGPYTDPLMMPRIAIDAFLSINAGQYEVLHKQWMVIIRKRT